MRFPWPVEVFLSDDHLPKYKVCNISVCNDYITAAHAMYSTWGASHPILCLEQRGLNVAELSSCARLLVMFVHFDVFVNSFACSSLFVQVSSQAAVLSPTHLQHLCDLFLVGWLPKMFRIGNSNQ